MAVVIFMHEKSIRFLEKQLCKATISLNNALKRNAVSQEIDALHEKISVLGYLISIVKGETTL